MEEKRCSLLAWQTYPLSSRLVQKCMSHVAQLDTYATYSMTGLILTASGGSCGNSRTFMMSRL
eukprot:5687466-Amphidinium_carterae.1